MERGSELGLVEVERIEFEVARIRLGRFEMVGTEADSTSW